MKEYIDLMVSFSKIGAFTFGGGYAMLPMLEKEIVENKHWTSKAELLDYFAIGQCTPGVIAVNTASFIGYNHKGIPGAIVATIGVIAPSFIIILTIASLLTNFADLPIVQHALHGIQIAVCALIFKAVYNMFKTGVKDSFGLLIFLIAFGLSLFSILPTVPIIIISAFTGILKQVKKVSSK